jgi:hypothetical protein
MSWSHTCNPLCFPLALTGTPGPTPAAASPGEVEAVMTQLLPVPGGPGATIVSLPDVGDTVVPSWPAGNAAA